LPAAASALAVVLKPAMANGDGQGKSTQNFIESSSGSTGIGADDAEMIAVRDEIQTVNTATQQK
jgi:hypothetical protein